MQSSSQGSSPTIQLDLPLEEKDTLYSTGVFHDSFCLEKEGVTAPKFKPYRFKVFEIFLSNW